MSRGDQTHIEAIAAVFVQQHPTTHGEDPDDEQIELYRNIVRGVLAAANTAGYTIAAPARPTLEENTNP